MARGTTARERQEATPVTVITPGDDDEPLDDDVEQAFDDWRSSFKSGEQPGLIRAYEIPIDERGNPIANASNQVRLGAWPIDLYGFDQLCGMLMRDFMTARKVLAVRLIGTKAGARGVRFNKIVVLRAPNEPPREDGAGRGESTTDIMRAINENNEKMMTQFRAMLTQATPPPDPRDEMRRTIEMATLLNGPSQKILELMLPALAGRPAAAPVAAAEPFSQLSGLLDVLEKLQDMRGGNGGGEGSSGSDLVDALRAVVPLAEPVVRAIPAIMAAQRAAAPAALPAPRPAPAPGAQPTTAAPAPAPRAPPPGSVPTPPPAAPAAAAPTPITDLPTGAQSMQIQKIAEWLAQLTAMATQGTPPAGAADLFFEQEIQPLSDTEYSQLSDLLSRDDYLTYMGYVNAAVTQPPLADWFAAFRARVLERYDAEEKTAAG